MTLAERFWAHVIVSDADVCWPWTRSRLPKGYGRIYVAGKFLLAHRVAYELRRGPIPSGLLVLHRCDNPPCCNPKHLFLGTHQDNVRDMTTKGRAFYINGERVGNAKLTEQNVRDARRLLADGHLTHREIGRELGVSATAISNIATGRTWGWLDPSERELIAGDPVIHAMRRL